MSGDTLLTVIGLALGLLTLLVAFAVRKTAAWEALVKIVTVLETKVEILWNTVTVGRVDALHHPEISKRIPDTLLEQFQSDTISTEGLHTLHILMDEVSKDSTVSDTERSAAIQMMVLVKGKLKLRVLTAKEKP